jgi:outer membrane autotransporter protein
MKKIVRIMGFAGFLIALGLMTACGGGGGSGGGAGSSSGGGAGGGAEPQQKIVDTEVTPTSQTIEEDYSAQYGLVGLIDSSFSESRLAELAGRIDISNNGTTDKLLADGYTHGENVALVVAGERYGDPRIYVYAMGAINDTGQLSIMTSMYRTLYTNGVRIFNQSFGGAARKPTTQDYPEYNAFLSFYRERAVRDSLFVWAAGNDGKKEASLDARLPELYPELEKGWLVVAAIDSESGILADYSNTVGDSAKNWGISAIGDYVQNGVKVKGTSFAAPAVSRAAAKVKMQYPWMSADLIRVTLLTTADTVDGLEVSPVYGWGLLNEEKALKGPDKLDLRLAFDEYGQRTDSVPVLIAESVQQQLKDIGQLIFSADITGDAGLYVKSSDDDGDGRYLGTLVLTGDNGYTGPTTVEKGNLVVTGKLAGTSAVEISKGGKLTALGTDRPGLGEGLAITHGGNKRLVEIKGNIRNDSGTLSVEAGGLLLYGDYENTDSTGILQIAIDSLLTVKGKMEFKNGKLWLTVKNTILSDIPTTKGNVKTVVEAEGGINGLAPGDIDTAEVTPYIAIDAKPAIVSSGGARESVTVGYHRLGTAMAAQALGYATASVMNTGQNLDRTLDRLAEQGAEGEMKRAAAAILSASASQLPATWDSLSGEIYATSQQLIRKETELLNRQLSDRLIRISSEEGDEPGLWFDSAGSWGRIAKSGWLTGHTEIQGAQVGYDRKFAEDLRAGLALSATKGEATFGERGGKSTAKTAALSLYGIYGKPAGFYALARIGAGYGWSRTERDIVINSAATPVSSRRQDMFFSGWIEGGWRFKASERITLGPYAGAGWDSLRRGRIKEDGHPFGLLAGPETYGGGTLALGFRAEAKAGRVKIGAHVTQLIRPGKGNTDFKARLAGDPGGPDWEIRGIPAPKQATRAGVGLDIAVNAKLSVQLSADLTVERRKVSSRTVSAGFRYRF